MQKKTDKSFQEINPKSSHTKILSFASMLLYFVYNALKPDFSEILLFLSDDTIFNLLSIGFTSITALSLYFYNSKASRIVVKIILVFFILYYILLSYINSIDGKDSYNLLFLFADFFILPTITFMALGLSFSLSKQNIEEKFEETKESEISLQTSKRRIFQTNNILYTLAIITLIGISIYLNLKNIDTFEIFEDEYQMMSVATTYYHTGEFKLWSYKNNKPSDQYYRGAYVHTWLIAQSFKFFGISLKSARLVSGLFGVIFGIIMLFVVYYFTQNKWLSLIIGFTIIFFHRYIFFAHYVRMYIVLLPMFILNSYLIFRALTEKMNFSPKGKFQQFIFDKLNFQYKYLPIILILIYFSWVLHQVTFITLPVTYLFITYLALFSKQVKYIHLWIIANILGFLLIIYFKESFSTGIFTFFDSPQYEMNKNYWKYILNYPFIKSFSLAILISGFILIFYTKSNLIKNKLIFLYLFIISGIILFVYVFNYKGVAFRYSSHIALMAIITISLLYFKILERIYNKKIAFLFASALIVISLSSWNTKYKQLYSRNKLYGYPSVAYNTLIKQMNPKEEVIFGQYFKYYHVPKSIRNFELITMKANKEYTFSEFQNDLKKSKKGWLIWMTSKSYHLDKKILDFIYQNFRQYHGVKMDTTLMELFYFDQSMIPGTPEYLSINQGVFATNAYIDLSKSNTISFWLRTNEKKPGNPIFIGKKDTPIIDFKDNENGELILTCNEKNCITTGNIADGTWHNAVIVHSNTLDLDIVELYVNGERKGIDTLENLGDNQFKLLISNEFAGEMQDMRIYNFDLNEKQIDAIFNNGEITTEARLEVDGQVFEPYSHFVIK